MKEYLFIIKHFVIATGIAAVFMFFIMYCLTDIWVWQHTPFNPIFTPAPIAFSGIILIYIVFYLYPVLIKPFLFRKKQGAI